MTPQLLPFRSPVRVAQSARRNTAPYIKSIWLILLTMAGYVTYGQNSSGATGVAFGTGENESMQVTSEHFGLNGYLHFLTQPSGTPSQSIDFGFVEDGNFKSHLSIAKGNITIGVDNTSNLKVHGTLEVDNIVLNGGNFNGSDWAKVTTTESTELSYTGGHVYISGAERKSTAAIKSEYILNYSLFVEEGVLSENFALAPRTSWADYVFREGYDLKDLGHVELYIKEHKHLPNIPSQQEISEHGYSLHDMNVRMLEKVEELTLYIIDQNKQMQLQKSEILRLKTELEKFESLSRQMSDVQAQLDRINSK